MRTIIHISDLHFGKTETVIENALKQIIDERKPNLVIVSGDITQRAKEVQFQQAHNFFSSLSFPVLSVPGNHDVPFYSFWRRFFQPYKLYKKYISENLEPQFEDEEMMVVGVNTVRLLKTMEGRVNKSQIARINNCFALAAAEKIKVLVSHHPFNVPVGHIKRPLARARLFWKNYTDTEIDLILSGHLHDTLELYLEKAYKLYTPGPLLIQAGTAISTRHRRSGNSFNAITISSQHIVIDRYVYAKENQIFEIKKTELFSRVEKKWIRDSK